MGAYGQYVNGRFFANAIGRYERFGIDITSPAAGLRIKPKGDSYGARGEVGMYYGGRVFIEPHATLEYVRTGLDDFTTLSSTLAFPDADGLRGRVGLRVGTAVTQVRVVTRLYAGVDAVHEFEGRDKVNFTNNGFVLPLSNRPIGTYGQAKAGVSYEIGPRVKGYVEGFGDFGSRYSGAGGRAGVSIRF